MQAFIVSDLHLGSSETKHDAFSEFLQSLPVGATLVLNGDITNDASKNLPCDREGNAILDQLCRESLFRPIIWLGGNNDTGYRPQAYGQIEFRDYIAFGKQLYVCHGHEFLALPCCSDALQKMLRRTCNLFCHNRGRTLHMTDFLRYVPLFYRLACHLVARGAIRFARRHGYAAIACGHTHHAEEMTVDGVRYFNTGAWTQTAPYYLELRDSKIVLLQASSQRHEQGTTNKNSQQTTLNA